MKKSRTSLLLILLITALGCEDDGNSPLPHFANPQKMRISSVDVDWQGRSRRLTFVTNHSIGTITPLDLVDQRVLDTDDFDDVETPITVGGNPTLLFEWRPSNLAGNVYYRLVVCDPTNTRLHVFNAKRVIDASNVSQVVFEAVDMGGPETWVMGEPHFFDRGRSSNPSITAITLDTAVAREENWHIISNGRREWTLEGSISGRQRNRVISGTPYVSDDGSLSFTIFEFDRRADAEDAFYFGTRRTKPLQLADAPDAGILIDNSLYLAMHNSGTLQAIDLDTQITTGSVNLVDGSGFAPQASDIQYDGSGHLLITNRSQGNSVFLIDLGTLTSTAIQVGVPTQRALIKNNMAYLLPVGSREVLVLDLNQQLLSTPSIRMGDFALVGALLVGNEGVAGDAIMINNNNTLDLLNLADRQRVDTRDRGDTESFASTVHFFDVRGKSNPSLSEIITRDGLVQNESWSIEYEGAVANSPSNSGSVAGTLFVDFSGNFQRVLAGDLLILNPDNPTLREAIPIATVVDNNTLSLQTAPATQGANIFYEARVRNSYTIFGSFSGLQQNRAREGFTSESDDGAITFSISPAAPSSPTTIGDIFTFDTSDGVTPVILSGSNAVDVHLFERRAYVLQQNSNSIAVVDLPSLTLQGGIN